MSPPDDLKPWLARRAAFTIRSLSNGRRSLRDVPEALIRYRLALAFNWFTAWPELGQRPPQDPSRDDHIDFGLRSCRSYNCRMGDQTTYYEVR